MKVILHNILQYFGIGSNPYLNRKLQKWSTELRKSQFHLHSRFFAADRQKFCADWRLETTVLDHMLVYLLILGKQFLCNLYIVQVLCGLYKQDINLKFAETVLC